jgi:hypothetical protein
MEEDTSNTVFYLNVYKVRKMFFLQPDPDKTGLRIRIHVQNTNANFGNSSILWQRMIEIF